MRRYLLPLLLLLLFAGPDASAAPPPIKGVAGIGLTVAGDTINAAWGYISPGLFATDTATLTWASKALGATTWSGAGTAKSRGTTASKVIPQAATGDSVRLCIVVSRVGANPSPTKCGYKYRAPAASGGVDTIQLSLRSIIVRPDSVAVVATVAGQAITSANQAQFCTAARLSDDSVILTTTSKTVAGCDLMFADVVGLVRGAKLGRLVDAVGQVLSVGRIEVAFEQEGVQFQRADGSLGPKTYIVRPKVSGAFKAGSEWWLVNPLPVPTSS